MCRFFTRAMTENSLSLFAEVPPQRGSGHDSPKILPEHHLVARVGWLRAAVLGANDGIVSTASLILGVATAGGSRANILIAGKLAS